MDRAWRSLFMLALLLASACSTHRMGPATGEASATLLAPDVEPLPNAPIAALRVPDAPGLAVDALALRAEDALEATSGVVAVSEIAVRAELKACQAMPCADAEAQRFAAARFAVDSSVTLVGDRFMATVRIQDGVHEVARATGTHASALEAMSAAGRAAGAALHAWLMRERS